MAKGTCYGTKDSSYGKFKFNQDCDLVGLRLNHVSGEFNSRSFPNSRWGWGGSRCWSVVTNSSDSLIFPTNLSSEGQYVLDGFNVKDQLIFHKRLIPVKVQKSEEMRIWFGADLINNKMEEDGYKGRHCVHVDVSCLE